MNGPNIVCAACGEPTTIMKPLCDACARAAGQEPKEPCVWCERGHPLDASGQFHVTKTGGHMGRCMANVTTEKDQ